MTRAKVRLITRVWLFGWAALFLRAAASHAAAAPEPEVPPLETELEAPGPLGPLKGTLLFPPPTHTAAARRSVALILPGSGPTDREGNSPHGVRAASYRLLAHALGARGIITLRIDKRGLAGSREAVPDGNAVTIADYVADVHAWIAVIRSRTGAPCVWLLGHSEGGLIAMAAATQSDVCGLVLMAAPGRPMGQVLRDQLKANSANAPLLPWALPALDTLERGSPVDTSGMPPPLQRLFDARVQPFMIDAFSYDPARLLARCAKPVLIVQGLRDLQVSQADAQLLKAADPHAVLTLLPGVNHVLKFVASDDRRANLATYADGGIPLAPGVAEAIAGFIEQAGAQRDSAPTSPKP